MAIELGDGLQFEEVLEIAKRLDIKKLLSPELRDQLTSGINALLAIQSIMDGLPPFLLQLLPFPPGWRDQVNNAVVLARLAKAVIE